MYNDYTERTHCIFCESKLSETYFAGAKESPTLGNSVAFDYSCPVAHYSVPLSYEQSFVNIPFNVLTCSQCATLQNKYLGDMREIYKINHADSTGTTMMELHQTTRSILLKYSADIKTGIVEIGSSLGILADLIIEKLPDVSYTIVEPCFNGKRENKIIFDDFFENVDNENIKGNVLIISHVFEHFYKPLEILRKIKECFSIDRFLLVFPDLEYYLNNNVYHVLNTEHTYYVDNDFLIKQIERTLGFEWVETTKYRNHSVIFYFRKIEYVKQLDNLGEKLTNIQSNGIHSYFAEIFEKVKKYNEIIETHKDTHSIYLFPASIHSLYLTTFGLSDHFTGYLDNSIHKIGEKIYGTGKPIFNFAEIIGENRPHTIIFLNGGIFNSEVLNSIKLANNILVY